MRVVRAWPERIRHDQVPACHPHIIDDWPHVNVTDWDYREVATLGDDVIVLDWDIAVALEDIHRFAEHAREHADQVLVGPNRLYGLDPPVWAASRYTTPARQSMRWVSEGEPACHLFGFALVYLPELLAKRFVADNPGVPMTDVSFAGWHYNQVRQETRIDWSVRAVHLHYEVPEGGRV